LLAESRLNVPVTPILSGKLRRYHGIPLHKQLLDLPTTFKNLRDGILILLGFVQSLALLVVWWPDVVFTKGGFVCLPVGLAARLLRIPLVIHDSDAHPGLTNRILSRFATSIATGAPAEYYPYDAAKTTYVGIPIDLDFVPLAEAQAAKAKTSMGFDAEKPLIVITGGGLGARRLNDAIVMCAPELLKHAGLLHITGTANYDDVVERAPKHPHYKIVNFVSKNMHLMLGAADLAIARAGATTMLELASTHTPTILVPNAQLTGDHQTKNAQVYADAQAAIVLNESTITQNPDILTKTVLDLLTDKQRRSRLATAIGTFSKPEAADDVAAMIIAAAGSKH
jgi:UDP-N-acetylglucosamine--N-acetylmuramyl-(pentapeptide) pyrophosphoryl-undecaprenol N-acetylglucosamine transferase